ncbi:MAG: VOC family protein [Treponema sp.]|nr:VOC family protein [Treponema sp.]
MQTIVPHLWFDRRGAEAARLYTSLFPDSSLAGSSKISDTPSGEVETLSVILAGQEFSFLSAGPEFRFTPAVSFLVALGHREEVDRIWSALREGGSELMPLGAYPFSDRYAWVIDRFGLSWQLMLSGGPVGQRITPTLMFVGEQCGKTKEAVAFYASIFGRSRIDHILDYGPGEAPNAEGLVKHAAFRLEDQQFAAMDSAYDHGFAFNEAISFMVHCENQEQIDRLWARLSARPEAERCGWLKDRYGLSWQIVPRELGRMMSSPDRARAARVSSAFLAMKKLDLAALKEAYGRD